MAPLSSQYQGKGGCANSQSQSDWWTEPVTEVSETSMDDQLHLSAVWYASTNKSFDECIDRCGIDCRRGKYRGMVWPFSTRGAAEGMARRHKMERVHKINIAAMQMYYQHPTQGHGGWVSVRKVRNGCILDVSRLPGQDWCYVRPQFIESYRLGSVVPESRYKMLYEQPLDASYEKEEKENEAEDDCPKIEFKLKEKSESTPLNRSAQPYLSGSQSLNLLWYASTSEGFDEKIPKIGINCKNGRHRGCVYLTTSFQDVKITAERFGLNRVYAVDIGAMKQNYGKLVGMITNLKTTVRPLTLTVHRLPKPDRYFVRPQFLHCCWLDIPKLLPVHLPQMPIQEFCLNEKALAIATNNVKMAIMLFSSPVDVQMDGKAIVCPGADDIPSGRWWMKVDPRHTVYHVKEHFAMRLQLSIGAEDQEWFAYGKTLPDDSEIGRVVGHCDTIFVRPRIPDRLVPVEQTEPIVQVVDEEDFILVPQVDSYLELNQDVVLAAKQPDETEVPACQLWTANTFKWTETKKVAADPFSVETTPSMHGLNPSADPSPDLCFSEGGTSPELLNLSAEKPVDEGIPIYEEEVCSETGFNVLLKNDRQHPTKPPEQRVGLIGWLTRCRE